MFPFSSASSISKVPVVSVTVSAYVFLADQATITVLSFESDETGKVTAVNHYGTSQYARTIYEGEEETTFYYQFNAYGDVTALIGTEGNTIAKYEYDAFGNLTSQPDVKVNNSITYRGYEYDSETGLYYLNARYYDSETARFLTEDTYRGEKNDPLSLNLYTYCKNNPLKYVDPTGHSSVDFGYVSGSYELSEQAKKQKEARERQLEDDILALLRGGGAVFIGITVMAATGGMATPVVIWLALTLGGTATAFGLSDITQGVDGIYKHSTSDGVYYSINPIRDEFFNGDDYAYESTEMFVIQAASFTGTNGEAFADWLKSSVKYVSNKISTFLKSPFTPKGSGDPTLLYGTEIVEGGKDSTGYTYWKESIDFQGNKVYQRNDLFDPAQVSSWKDHGKTVTGTNVERMASGRAPIGYDGKSVNSHHLLQTPNGPIVEVSQSFHNKYYSTIHMNTGQSPSIIDRDVFKQWKSDYWMNRALDFD